MMVGFEDTTEDKKWLVPQRNKNIQCFFSDGNKSEHQDKCLGWRMLTSSIGSSETQLTLRIPQKLLIAMLFLSILLYLYGNIVVWTVSNFFVWTKKCSFAKLNWLEDDLSNTFWSSHKIFSKQRSVKVEAFDKDANLFLATKLWIR